MSRIMSYTYQHLAFIGMWPFQFRHKEDSLFIYRFVLVVILSSFGFWGGLFHYFFRTLKETDRNTAADMVSIIGQSGVIYFAAVFIVHKKDIETIRSSLSDFNTYGKPKNFDSCKQRLDFLSKLYRASIALTISSIVLWPVLATRECQKSNLTKNVKDVCGLVAPMWLPFEFDYFPVKQGVALWQAVCLLTIYGAGSTMSFAMYESMEYLRIRIEHLKQILPKIVDETESGTTKQKLFGKWVRYHLFILEIGKLMDKSYSYSLFLHVVGTGAVFAFIGHALITGKSTVNVIMLFLGWLSTLCLVCVGGQRLKDEVVPVEKLISKVLLQAISISVLIYTDTLWYNTPLSFQKNLLLVVYQSRRGILINAGPFTHISHVLMLTVLQTAVSYINLLKATSK